MISVEKKRPVLTTLLLMIIIMIGIGIVLNSLRITQDWPTRPLPALPLWTVRLSSAVGLVMSISGLAILKWKRWGIYTLSLALYSWVIVFALIRDFTILSFILSIIGVGAFLGNIFFTLRKNLE
jgi:hypothetical protein